MKLTLAMGLQYDNGKEARMFAMSMGQGETPPMFNADKPLKTEVVQLAVAQVNQAETAKQEPVVAYKKDHIPFFLTYNLKGLNDTLILDQSLVDLFV
ncbi:MAG: hypothetical protein Q9M16_01425 [Mariprofundus sp.]|nr:hypothetical protein [Mariprofundus sp.]